jgi:propionyl-CoA carboxylase alpha chain
MPQPTPTPITRVLIANRGEIARRIATTCRALGIATVAVFADPDAASPHVQEADCAVRLPGDSPTDTYLRGDLVIAAALRTGADAVHPGYGFLAENAGFARAVRDAGLMWIGPDPEAIEVMGSKVESKARMAAAGVPVLERLDPATLTAADLPVLVKASAGGGGRGMRIVRDLAALPEALDSAAREARSAFGDPTVFCERYLETGHHVEVQILADAQGTVWALGERECSLQRRHQKVIEEAPSPLVDRVGGDLRDRLLAAGRAAAAAVGYRGAGTVEFLADAHGEFWFLEMNTRLQVEHPVTECVTGIDLVAHQIAIAEGTPLTGAEPAVTGHAIEARLYAEDPPRGWAPQTGTVVTLAIPGVAARFTGTRTGIRLDSAVEPGSVVGTHYDAMLAKVVAWAPDRAAAARLLAGALAGARIHGLTTNRDLLVATLRHPEFLDGTASTAFYTEHPPGELTAGIGLDPGLGGVVAAVADAAYGRRGVAALAPSGFRNIPVGFRTRTYAAGDHEVEVAYRFGRDGLDLERLPDGVSVLELVASVPDRVLLDIDGVRRAFGVTRFGEDDATVVVDSPEGSVTLRRVPRFVDPAAVAAPGSISAPMPGIVVRLGVAVGDRVVAGQPLLWLEAMKMEHPALAPTTGVVTALAVAVGDQVEQGATLAVVADDGDG